MEENITIEFVKEWIDKHNLTKGSFKRILRDLIYNTGHNYIDNPSLRYWLIDNTYKFRDMLPVELNDNQQVAINNAKKSFEKGADLYDCAIDMMLYDGLTDKEWAKVTVAFLLWAQEQEEE